MVASVCCCFCFVNHCATENLFKAMDSDMPSFSVQWKQACTRMTIIHVNHSDKTGVEICKKQKKTKNISQCNFNICSFIIHCDSTRLPFFLPKIPSYFTF